MKWQEVRQLYPEKWLLIEALTAHTTTEQKRILENISVLDSFSDFYDAMDAYKINHKVAPKREMYVVHSINDEIDIEVRHWVGIRGV